MSYSYILTYTKESHKERLMEICEAYTEEELVGISLVPFEGNKKFVEYIDQALDV